MSCRCGAEFCYACGLSYINGVHHCNYVVQDDYIINRENRIQRQKEESIRRREELQLQKLEEKVKHWRKVGKKIPTHLNQYLKSMKEQKDLDKK